MEHEQGDMVRFGEPQLRGGVVGGKGLNTGIGWHIFLVPRSVICKKRQADNHPTIKERSLTGALGVVTGWGVRQGRAATPARILCLNAVEQRYFAVHA